MTKIRFVPKKNIYLQVRISEEEREIIQQKAQECGLTMSDFIRELTFGYRIRNNAQQKETLLNISRIASNIHKMLGQIARYMNTFKEDTDKVKLLTALLLIEKDIMEVRAYKNI